jgi:hypothetical protein
MKDDTCITQRGYYSKGFSMSLSINGRTLCRRCAIILQVQVPNLLISQFDFVEAVIFLKCQFENSFARCKLSDRGKNGLRGTKVGIGETPKIFL